LDITTLLRGCEHPRRADEAQKVVNLFFPYAQSRPSDDRQNTSFGAITVGAFIVGFEPDGGIFNEKFLTSLKQQLAVC
jgi:hypothetical protein